MLVWAGKQALHFLSSEGLSENSFLLHWTAGEILLTVLLEMGSIQGKSMCLFRNTWKHMVGIPKAEAVYPILLEHRRVVTLALVLETLGCVRFASCAAELYITSSWQCLCGTTSLSSSLTEILIPSLLLRPLIN